MSVAFWLPALGGRDLRDHACGGDRCGCPPARFRHRGPASGGRPCGSECLITVTSGSSESPCGSSGSSLTPNRTRWQDVVVQAGALRQTVARFGVLGDQGTVGLECRRARTAGSVRVPPEHMPFLHRNPRGNGLATARLDADGCVTRRLAWGGVRASDRLR
jgi:hypothetical protein